MILLPPIYSFASNWRHVALPQRSLTILWADRKANAVWEISRHTISSYEMNSKGHISCQEVMQWVLRCIRMLLRLQKKAQVALLLDEIFLLAA